MCGGQGLTRSSPPRGVQVHAEHDRSLTADRLSQLLEVAGSPAVSEHEHS